MVSPQLKDLANEWLRLDHDPETREEMYRLLVNGDEEELGKRLTSRIAFGTAGLRGRMEAGFSRLNSLTVIQASQGLAAYLLEQDTHVKKRGIVVGRDARHNSEKYAKLATAAFVAQGIKVWWYELPVHTPLVPFGLRELGAAAGIMITASHNPAQDNGYKVYWSNGCQIIPPHDAGIAAAIEQNLEPVTWDTSVVDEDDLRVEGSIGLVRDAYFRAVRSAAVPETLLMPAVPRNSLKFVYTPLHGVGYLPMNHAVSDIGMSAAMTVVTSQGDPNPDFPTVPFPNPEEKGALDAAIDTADQRSIPLIIASDPDADRLAVAEKVDGKWHQLTGNQLGILLASHIFETYSPEKPKEKLAMLASTVSSRMLAHMAHVEGFHYKETLTGFKWLGNASRDLDAEGYNAAFAFEEALGYMITSIVRDKDAISAAAVVLVAQQRWRNDGLSPWTKLQTLYEKYGYFDDANTYLITPSPEVTAMVLQDIEDQVAPDGTPTGTLGNRHIKNWILRKEVCKSGSHSE